MWKIWIYEKEKLEEFLLEDRLSWRNIVFEIKDTRVMAVSEDGVLYWESGTAKSLSDCIIHAKDCSLQSWYAYPLSQTLTIGRGKDVDLRIASGTVSNHHFTIKKEEQYVLYDHGSTNGTYVNAKRVHTVILQSADRISFAGLEGYIVKDYLILDHKLKGYCSVLKEECTFFENVIPDIKEMDISPPLSQSYEIELPHLHPKPKKSHLFQAVGSSVLILVSGIASALVMRLFSPDNQERIIMMLMTSGSMCLAFLLYGLMNREIQWKDKLKEEKSDEESYRHYVQSCERELDRLKEAYQRKIVSILDLYRSLPDSAYRLMVKKEINLCPGLFPKEWIVIKTGRSGYQYQKNALFLYLQTVIKNWSSPMMSCVFIQAGQTWQIRYSESAYLFIEWCWLFWNPSRKWIWIIPNETIPDAFAAFEGSLEDHIRLVIKKEEDVIRIQRVLDEKKQYVIYSSEQSLLKKLSVPKGTIVLEGMPHSKHQSLELCYEPIEKLSQFQRYQRMQNHQKIRFQDLFGDNPMPSDSVNLEIVLGMDDQNHPIRFDLSEYGDGPHGFIAGMTGSGKSELISSLLMQLVLNNDPKHLQYLIIDFKGGAFGQAFYNFAHCAGMLTNLEKEELSRFQKGIRFELERRQHLLKEFTKKYNTETAHIDAYNEKMPDCISHLLIIVDELAQLKAEAPDFMASLKEIARVGRSLGIHCLLSTQKPLGIIDDQILANSKFKICLAVSSKADSHEVLHHERAFYLNGAGKFILQIQNKDNEYVGQSFWLHQNREDNSNFWMEVDKKDEVIRKSKDASTQSISQFYSQKVLDLYPYHEYVIPLFDQSLFRKHKDVLAMIDIPQRNTQIGWDITFGESAVILCKKSEEIHKLAGAIRSFHHNHPVYTANIDNQACDFPSLSQLSSVDTILDDCTLIVSVQNLSDISAFLSIIFHKHVRAFCFISQYKSQDQWILHSFTERLCFESGNIDELRSFFELFVPVSTRPMKGKGLLVQDNEAMQILFQDIVEKNDPPAGNVFRYKKEKKGYFVGTYQRKRVYWHAKHKLLICYAQKSRKDKIEHMIERWQAYRDFIVSDQLKEPFDICVLNMVRDLSQINSPVYKELMYDLDVMWIGEGFEDYSFYLKKKLNSKSKGKNYLWQEDDAVSFEISEDV